MLRVPVVRDLASMAGGRRRTHEAAPLPIRGIPAYPHIPRRCAMLTHAVVLWARFSLLLRLHGRPLACLHAPPFDASLERRVTVPNRRACRTRATTARPAVSTPSPAGRSVLFATSASRTGSLPSASTSASSTSSTRPPARATSTGRQTTTPSRPPPTRQARRQAT